MKWTHTYLIADQAQLSIIHSMGFALTGCPACIDIIIGMDPKIGFENLILGRLRRFSIPRMQAYQSHLSRLALRSPTDWTVSLPSPKTVTRVLQIWNKVQSRSIHWQHSILPAAKAFHRPRYVAMGRRLLAVEHLYPSKQATSGQRMAGIFCKCGKTILHPTAQALMLWSPRVVHTWRVLAMGISE